MILGLILARGGSKRIPGKNVRTLGTQPLLIWTITAGHYSKCDVLAVSSEDREIQTLARRCGVEVIERPEELATDEISSYPAMLHALDSLEETFDYLCLLQPTSPFRHPWDIDVCITKALISDYPAVASFTEGAEVPNGAVYVGRVDWLRDGGSFDSAAVERYYMPLVRSIDIDTEDDWTRAEAML